MARGIIPQHDFLPAVTATAKWASRAGWHSHTGIWRESFNRARHSFPKPHDSHMSVAIQNVLRSVAAVLVRGSLMTDRNDVLTRPASHQETAPLVSRPVQYAKLAWAGALALVIAVSLAGLNWDRQRVADRKERDARDIIEFRERMIQSLKDTPQDKLDAIARKRHADMAADFVDRHVSWRLLSKRGENPVRTEPSRAIQQLGILAGEISAQAAFKSFKDKNEYRWMDMQLGDPSSWKDRNRTYHVATTLQSMNHLLGELRRDPKFEMLLKEPRFSDAASMLGGLAEATLNDGIGIGFKPLPK
jgi:hypothetical protein